MSKKLIFFGESIGRPQCNTEWFPCFNHHFRNNFLIPNFEVITAKCISTKGHGRVYEYEGHKVTINANNLILLNPSNNKSVSFTTYYNLAELRGSNKKFFKETLIKCFSGHYNDALIEIEWPEADKISPWYFRPHFWGDVLTKNQYSPTKNQAFFRGIDIKDSRDFIKILQSQKLPDVNVKIGKMPPADYAQEICSSRCAINAPGVRDMCYRDIDNFGMGIPTIRPHFTSRLLIDIPEDIYFPVDHKILGRKPNPKLQGMPSDHKSLAKDVLKKWNEVKDDESLLNKVSNNAKDFHTSHFTNDKIAKNSLKLLEESGIFD